MIKAMESATPGDRDRMRELVAADRAFETGMLVGPIARPILTHHIDVSVAGYLLGQKPERRFRAGEAVGQHQMPDEKAAPCESRGVDREIPDLPMHLAQRGPVDAHIVPDMRISMGGRVVAIFYIWHVDVDDAIEQSQSFEAVVSAGVVDQRKLEPALGGDGDGPEDLRHDMARADQIYVMAAERLQPEHHVGELLVRYLAALALPGNLPVLAIDAAQAALRKEDRARSARAPETILLAVVGPRGIDDRSFSGAAHRAANGAEPIDAAKARAEIAALHVAAGSVSACAELA